MWLLAVLGRPASIGARQSTLVTCDTKSVLHGKPKQIGRLLPV